MALWDDEDGNEEFRDVPVETGKDYKPQIEVPAYRPAPMPQSQPGQVQFNGATGRFEEPVKQEEEYLEEILESVESEDDFASVLNDANLRIEQGRLYQMIMNHELFEGMDADPKAVQNVQKEIRKFARERMEIMLGMRQEQTHIQQIHAVSQFNDLEVYILKKLASKATNEATETPEANQVAAAVREAPRRQTLNTLGGSTGLKKTTQVIQPKVTQSLPKKPVSAQSLPKTPTAPLPRTKNQIVIDQILAEEGISRADLELEYTGIGKPLHLLTEEELHARQKQSAERLAKRKTVKSPNALPMASPEQEMFLATQRASQFAQVTGMAALIDKVSKMPIKNP